MAASYNELFGLGSHSEDASIEGWWALQDDAANTTIDDLSSNALDGTLVGGNNTADLSTTGPNSWLTKSLNLDGSADFINFGDTASLESEPLTTLARFRVDNTSSQHTIFGKWNTGSANREHIFYTDGSGVLSGLISSSGSFQPANIVTGSTVSATTWYSGAFVFDGGNTDMLLYLDGASDGSNTSGPASMHNGTSNAIAGAHQNGTYPTVANYFDGLLADVSFWSRALTSAEIAEHDAGPEPVNSVSPVVSGTETQGQTLACTTGTWGLASPFASGTNGTITYSYQWTRSDNGSGLNEADISGATSSTYTLGASDVGKYIRCRVRASNDGGFDSAADTNSGFTGAIASSGGATTAVGSASGTATASGTGLSTFETAGSSAGSATATAVGASTVLSAGSAAGIATAAAVGSSTSAAAGSSAGLSTATAVSTGTITAAGSSAGTATALAGGSGTATSAGSAAGTSTATATYGNVASGAGSASGSATVSGIGALVAAAIASANGIATALAVSEATITSVGSAAGTSSVTAVSVGGATYIRVSSAYISVPKATGTIVA